MGRQDGFVIRHHPRKTCVGATRRALLATPIACALLALCAMASLAATPNDPFFAEQWGAANSGQPIPTEDSDELLDPEVPGTPGADEDALEAWGVTTGSRSIVIGETDTGVDYTHPDLAANIWSNPGAVNGCPAGTHGYDVLNRACDPMDEETLSFGGDGGHGTHVAGIIGALGDNGLGVAGINWQSTILPVKWLQTANSANETEHLVEALEWLVKAQEAGVNVRVVNDSPVFPNSGPSPELEHEIKVLGEHQILFVTAAGNTGEDDDDVLRYPCKYRLANEICVTASNNEDKLPSWANTGKESVDLAAPGASIYSTIRPGQGEDAGEYRYLSGGSMAAAEVSGAAALILSAEPWLSVGQLKAAILDNVDPLPALAGKVATGGRLDIAKALPALVSEVSPDSGPAGGGTQVTVTGANLARASAVTFGSASASFTVNSPTSITATTPPGSGTVDVTVFAPGGPSASGAGDRFSYISPPLLRPPPTAAAAAAPTVVQPVPEPASTIGLVSARLAVKRGHTAVRLRCVGTSRCVGTIVIAVKQAIRRGKRIVGTRLVTIARGRFSLGAGRSESFSLALTRSGRSRLSAENGNLTALLTVPQSATMRSSLRSTKVRLVAVVTRKKSTH
jgi:subtilisin family serine protease